MLAYLRSGGNAGLADLVQYTQRPLGVLSYLLLAGIVRNTIIIRKIVNTARVTTVASTATLAVDDHLDTQRDGGESVLAQNVDSV